MPDLPGVSISDQEEDEMRNRWNTIDEVRQALVAKGIVISDDPPPFALPEVATTLVDENSQEYLKTNAKYLAWLNYITPQISLNEGIILQVRNEKTNIEALYRDAARRADEGKPPTQRMSKEEIWDNTLLDTRYIELLQFEQELLQQKSLLEDKKEEISRVLRVISRHIEVKKLEADLNRTAANLPQRRPFNPPHTQGGS